MKKLLLIALVATLPALGACSKGDEIVFDTAVGPATALQVKNLPETLAGDKDNARYSDETLKGPNMESADGTTE